MATLQTHVLGQDGTFAVQNITIDDIIAAQDSLEENAEPAILPRPEKTGPEYGIMTKTLIQAPITKFVFRARIRTSAFRELIFVKVCKLHICMVI